MARDHAVGGGATDAGHRPQRVRADVSRDARGWIHGSRRVPLPRPGRSPCCGRGGVGDGHRTRAPSCRLRAWGSPPLPAELGRRVPRTGRDAARRRDRRRRRPPLRSRVPCRLARGDRALRGVRRAPAPHPRRRAAERDRGVPRRARLPPDRAPRPDRLPDGAHDGGARDTCRRCRARPPRLVGRDDLCLSDDGGRSR